MCRVKVCVCIRMAALLISVGWFAMVCILLLFHFCLFHISLVRMILSQKILEGKHFKNKPRSTDGSLNTDYLCCIHCMCKEKRKKRLDEKQCFFQSRYPALFACRWNIHNVFWFKLNRINTASTSPAQNERNVAARWQAFLETSTSTVFTLLGGSSQLVVFSAAARVCGLFTSAGRR